MTPSRDPDADTQHAAAALPGAPETAAESDRDRALAALFGTPGESAGQPPARSEAEEAARHEQLAALFGGAPTAAAAPAAETSGADRADTVDVEPATFASEPRDTEVGTSAAGVTQEAVQVADVAPARGMRRGRRRPAAADESGSAPNEAGQSADVDRADLTGGAPAPEERPEAPAWLAAAAGPLAAGAVAANVERNSDEAASDAPAADDAVGAPANADASGDAGPDVDDDPLAWLGFTDEPASDDDTGGTEDEPAGEAAGADAPAAPMSAVDWASLVNGTAATSVLPAAADDTTELLGTPGARRATADGDTPHLLAGNPTFSAEKESTRIGATTGAATTLAAASSVTGALTAGSAAGSFSPTEKRGIRSWSTKMRWSVAISIVLLAGVVAGSILIAQTVAANSREAQELSAAVAELEAAEAAATEPEFALQEAIGIYDDTVALAQATADSAGPPLAAVTGMTDETLLAASNTALADLVAQLAIDTAFETPAAYERGDVDLTDVDAITAATGAAEVHAAAVTAATDEVVAAQAALQQKLDALRAAQVALGASLPATAEVIAAENPRAEQSFRDAVIAAAAAVPAAQNAGGSGDPELSAYAEAVTALRGDQVRAEEVVQPVRPANPAPQPTPTTDPAPAPEPEPAPVPDPPTDPAPEPDPSGTPTP